MMNARKRHDRLSTLLLLPISKTCQTQLSCLSDIDKTISSHDFSNVTVVQTNNPNRIERQIQVDTIQGHYDDLCQVRIEIAENLERDPMNDEQILQALIDKDGKRIIITDNRCVHHFDIGQPWSELVDQLVNEQSNRSANEKVQQLFSAVRKVLSD